MVRTSDHGGDGFDGHVHIAVAVVRKQRRTDQGFTNICNGFVTQLMLVDFSSSLGEAFTLEEFDAFGIPCPPA